MADEYTRRSNARIDFVRANGIPTVAAALALVLQATSGLAGSDALIDFLSPLLRLAPGLKLWLLNDPWGRLLAGWIGPPLGAFLLTRKLTKTKSVERAMDRALPRLPPFASADLRGQLRRSVLRLEDRPAPFVGRVDEMAALAAMFERFSGVAEPFVWRVLSVRAASERRVWRWSG